MAVSVQIKRIAIAASKSTELRYTDAGDTAKAAILILPALGVAASYYDRLLKSLAKAGHPAVVIDLQGQGNSSVVASRKVNFGYQELLTQDIPSAITATVALFDRKVILLGHSLGGQAGSLYCGLGDGRVIGLVLCTCCSVYYKSWKGRQRLKVLTGSQAARICAWLLGYFPGKKFNFGGLTGQRLINDWGHQALTGTYKIAGSQIKWEKALAGITLPVLALHLHEDFLAPPEAVAHLCQKLSSAPLKTVEINQPQLNHFTWTKHSELFIAEINTWYRDTVEA